uniref:Uncharacterized protein n=1 Tax=Avena sativa TaxID=4498 RepID=A0ACD5YA45_AVESA
MLSGAWSHRGQLAGLGKRQRSSRSVVQQRFQEANQAKNLQLLGALECHIWVAARARVHVFPLRGQLNPGDSMPQEKELWNCLRSKEGGFGIKDLHRQNRCLLLNFVHKLHQTDSLPWKDWYRLLSGRDLGDVASPPSFLDRIVLECLPLYRSITRAGIVSGSTTSFWLDRWLPGRPLAERYAALFSHVTRPNATVATVVASGLSLQPRLSSVAGRELGIVQGYIDAIALLDGQDLRYIDSPSAPPFSSREAYHMLSPWRAPDVSACQAWALKLPAKISIFVYLADIDRLSTRANLFSKNCAPSGSCEACTSPETERHLFFDCAIAVDVWGRLRVPIPHGAFSVWELAPPTGVDSSSWRAGIATILWSLWKARNDLTFNVVPSTARLLLRRAADDLSIWRWRYKAQDHGCLDNLRTLLVSAAV